ncbi:GNAT family N-acetyltransferase [Candidatus Pacearchaeota archaeon]|nr:GNAT family N-acetyltransferase [Candidatus Pacearchaeota archaeon]
MATKIELRNQRVSDAKRFFEILNNSNFKYFHVCPKDEEAEREFLRRNTKKRKNNLEYNYAILCNGKLVGGCGIKIDQHRTFIGEISYFLDEEYWSKGIVTKSVKILEKIGFQKLGLKRIKILMNLRNIGSEKVAIKCGYKKEGTMKRSIKDRDKFFDAHLYAKVMIVK